MGAHRVTALRASPSSYSGQIHEPLEPSNPLTHSLRNWYSQQWQAGRARAVGAAAFISPHQAEYRPSLAWPCLRQGRPASWWQLAQARDDNDDVACAKQSALAKQPGQASGAEPWLALTLALAHWMDGWIRPIVLKPKQASCASSQSLPPPPLLQGPGSGGPFWRLPAVRLACLPGCLRWLLHPAVPHTSLWYGSVTPMSYIHVWLYVLMTCIQLKSHMYDMLSRDSVNLCVACIHACRSSSRTSVALVV